MPLSTFQVTTTWPCWKSGETLCIVPTRIPATSTSSPALSFPVEEKTPLMV
jgi:hypothetical protein